MKITSLLSNLIVEESRLQFLYDKFVKPQAKEGEEQPKKGIIDFDTLKKIIFSDPTTEKKPANLDVQKATLADMEKVKVGKYVNWLLKNYLKPKNEELGLSADVDTKDPRYKEAVKEFRKLYLEDLYKVKDDLNKFQWAKNLLPVEQRNVDLYTPRTFFELLKDIEKPKKKEEEAQKKEAKKSRSGFSHAGSKIVLETPNWTNLTFIIIR